MYNSSTPFSLDLSTAFKSSDNQKMDTFTNPFQTTNNFDWGFLNLNPSSNSSSISTSASSTSNPFGANNINTSNSNPFNTSNNSSSLFPQQSQNQNEVQWLAQNYKNVAKEYVKKYYQLFVSDPMKLEGFYLPNAMITFNEIECVGFKQLVNFWKKMDWKNFKIEAETIDAQPVGGKKLLVMVTGYLVFDYMKYRFSEFTTLAKHKDGNFYIQNNMFRRYF